VDACDVLVVGGGPAGSACARRLHQAGLDVVVLDRAHFPRDKVCAGWITPQVVDALQIDILDYGRGRTLQPISGFRVGLIGENDVVEVRYDAPVSYGIRRCEFDDYLLRRSGARLLLGTAVERIRRDGPHWVINDTIVTPMLVGAGGHFCPVSRLLNVGVDRAPRIAAQIAAQEVELEVGARGDASFAVRGDTPELYFCRDLRGYGWCFRKGGHVNLGLGRDDLHGLPMARAEFIAFLRAAHRIPEADSWPWHGHTYLLAGPGGRRVIDDAVMLVGDAAGLAHPQSGEGIRPAVESGFLAADAILEARGRYDRARLQAYERRLRPLVGTRSPGRLVGRLVPRRLTSAVAARLMRRPWFVRHVLLERCFLHGAAPAHAFA
jgi:menaquinone-9 beta-reductase